MPRASTAIENQRAGGSKFAFQPGAGRITDATVACEHLGSWAAIGYRITVQRLDAKFKATEDEPLTEFLPLASANKQDGEILFRPGIAKNADDVDFAPLSDDDDTEGNALWAASEELKPDQSLGGCVFSASLQAKGVPATKLSGYAPNLIGIVGIWDRAPLRKSRNAKEGDPPPTCLVIKELIETPWDKSKKAAGAGAGAAAGTATAAAGTGKAKSAAAAVPPAPAAESNGAGDDGEVVSEHDGQATELAVKIGTLFAGQTVSRGKISTRLLTLYPKLSPAPGAAAQKAIGDLFKSDAWFAGKAGELDWTIDGENVKIPAA